MDPTELQNQFFAQLPIPWAVISLVVPLFVILVTVLVVCLRRRKPVAAA